MNVVGALRPEILVAAEIFVPRDRIVALRTHASPTRYLLPLLMEGRAQAQVTIRDPRDLALSLLDVAEKQNALGLSRRDDLIAQRGAVSATLERLSVNVGMMSAWADMPGALVLDYEQTAFDPRLSIASICRQLGIAVPEEQFDAVFAQAATDPRGKKNVAAPRRHRREMAPEDQRLVLDRFPEFYERFYPGADVDVDDSDRNEDRVGSPADRAAAYRETLVEKMRDRLAASAAKTGRPMRSAEAEIDRVLERRAQQRRDKIAKKEADLAERYGDAASTISSAAMSQNRVARAKAVAAAALSEDWRAHLVDDLSEEEAREQEERIDAARLRAIELVNAAMAPKTGD
ncbi:hypothetical protein JOD31_003293 [Methylopila capsulata]|uniref:Uncharacterized protein n=1 Tax=Methylopila capsulata TaxID=61654 RepID=A0ABS2TDZ0_9HYPH|nr:hypothetical protein [Methylopila capsulata]MBM7853042.1 hypothetical protein [Methylopila capsulata]